MSALQIERVITALDVGSSKICAMIVGQTAEGALHVLGTGMRASKGIRRGYVVDIKQSEEVIREVISQAEKNSGYYVDDVWVSFANDGLTNDVIPIESRLASEMVTEADIDDLLSATRKHIPTQERMILHAFPTLYTLDGASGIKNPVGLRANRLAVDLHAVMSEKPPVYNLETAVRAAHLNVKSIIASPIAAGLACLSQEDKELGVALIELGAEVTIISLYIDGMFAGLEVLPFGANDITNDIASTFGVSRRTAQRLQSFYGSALVSVHDNREMIPLSDEADSEEEARGERISRVQLITVIRDRLNIMMKSISERLQDMNFVGPVGRRVVFVGGGAELNGIATYGQTALARATHIGKPHGLIGLPEAHAGPGFVTLAGLILYAVANPLDMRDIPLLTHRDKWKWLPENSAIGQLITVMRSKF